MHQETETQEPVELLDPPVAAQCECEQPDPVERAERKGAARAYCARCDLPIPVRLGVSAGAWR
jgi:hypothetical protein